MSDSPHYSTTSILANTFSGLSAADMAALKQVAVARNYPNKSYICRQGDVADTFFVIVSGVVAVEQHLPDDSSRLLGTLKQRDYFGETGLLDGRPRMADCFTMQPCTVLEISREEFERLVQTSPAVGYAIMRKMVANLRRVDEVSMAELTAKNEALQRAYDELQAAQTELVAKRALEHELAIAAQVQRDLLPGQLPEHAGYQFAGLVQPARLVGGDLFDIFDIDTDHLGIVIADVADKGVHASLYMAVARTLFLQAGKRSLSPAEVALAVHQGLLDVSTMDDTFVTAFYGVLQRSTGRLNYIIAGQERPLLYRHGGGVTNLPGKGRFLGMLRELTLAEYETQLESGDRLVIFSDGVTDAQNLRGESFGTGRLGILINQFGHLPAAELLAKINGRLQSWSSHVDQYDDITLVVAAVGPGP